MDKHPDIRTGAAASEILRFNGISYCKYTIPIPDAIKNRNLTGPHYVFKTLTYVDNNLYYNPTGEVILKMQNIRNVGIYSDNIHMAYTSTVDKVINTETFEIVNKYEFTDNRPVKARKILYSGGIQITQFYDVTKSDELPALINNKSCDAFHFDIIRDHIRVYNLDGSIKAGAKYTLIKIPCDDEHFSIYQIVKNTGQRTKAALHKPFDYEDV